MIKDEQKRCATALVHPPLESLTATANSDSDSRNARGRAAPANECLEWTKAKPFLQPEDAHIEADYCVAYNDAALSTRLLLGF